VDVIYSLFYLCASFGRSKLNEGKSPTAACGSVNLKTNINLTSPLPFPFILSKNWEIRNENKHQRFDNIKGDSNGTVRSLLSNQQTDIQKPN
jgi:hypothetical protein